MPYLIDGHNLIPKVPGLSLDDPEDEKGLIELLQAFCQRTGKAVQVYFDNAPPGQAHAQVHGLVTARFVRQGQTADQAISRHLRRLGNEAANWTVVSSDRQVKANARAARAQVIGSAAFAVKLLDQPKGSEEPETLPSEEEVEEWLRLFGEHREEE